MEPNRQRLERLWLAVLQARGNVCEECREAYNMNRTMPNLQFAHVSPTKLRGMGRGKWARVCDIRAYPDAYRLLCEPCHKKQDGPMFRNRGWRAGDVMTYDQKEE